MESKIDSELLVGIEKYVNELFKPLHFAYKYRYSDFIVHEVQVDGSLVPYNKEDLEGNL